MWLSVRLKKKHYNQILLGNADLVDSDSLFSNETIRGQKFKIRRISLLINQLTYEESEERDRYSRRIGKCSRSESGGS